MIRRGQFFLACLCVLTVLAAGLGLQSCSKPQAPSPAPAAQQETAAKSTPAATAEPQQEKTAPPATPAPAAQKPEEKATPAPAPQNNAQPAVAQQSAPSADPTAKPKIVCDEPTFNFGERDADTVVEHTFVLRNAGNATLEITEVKPGCGCTTTNLETRTLAPGQEVKLGAKLDLKGRQGLQTKPIMVMSNDPETPSLQLTMTGTAVPAIEVDPQMVNFMNVMDDNPREQTIRIVAKKQDITFKVLEVTAQDLDAFTHELKEITPGREYAIELKSKGALPEGSKNGRLIIRTDNPQRPAILVNVATYVIGALKVMPNMINVRGSEIPGETEAQQISVMPGRVAAFELLEAVPPVDQIKTEIRKISDNNYVVKLEGIPRDSSIEGKELILKTNLAEKPEIKVPFHVFNFRVPGKAPATPAGPATPAAPPKPVTQQPVTPPAGVPSPVGVIQQ